jgi:hypothetical protein
MASPQDIDEVGRPVTSRCWLETAHANGDDRGHKISIFPSYYRGFLQQFVQVVIRIELDAL